MVEMTEKIKEVNALNLEYGSKEMIKLAKKIRKCSVQMDQEKLASHIVEASFFLNCFGVAGQAFKNAYEDIQDENMRGDVLFYLKEEFNNFYDSVHNKKDIEEAEISEVKNDNEN